MTQGDRVADTGDTNGSIEAPEPTRSEPTDSAPHQQPSFDPSAFFQQHYPGLRALLARRSGDPALAADLLGEAIEIALRKYGAGQIRKPQEMAGYVFQVAMNLWRNHRRNSNNRADRRADSALLDVLPVDAPPVDGSADTGLGARVTAIIMELPTERDRDLVKRFYLDEEDKESICRDLNLSPLHFDKVIFRARQRMRALLEAKGFRKTDFFSVLLLCAA
jgi:RNA polymerase sigma-70 factor, ECF subfamily